MPDLSTDLDRIARHIPCLDRAAADESAPAELRAAVAAMAQLARSAADLAGQHRTDPSDLELSRTEANHGH